MLGNRAWQFNIIGALHLCRSKLLVAIQTNKTCQNFRPQADRRNIEYTSRVLRPALTKLSFPHIQHTASRTPGFNEEQPRGRLAAMTSDGEDGQRLNLNGVSVKLDRASFKRVVPLKALSVPKQDCHRFMKTLRSQVYHHPRVKSVVADGDNQDRRLILLKEEISELEALHLPGILQESLKQGKIQEKEYSLELDYSLLSCEAILRQILPAGCDVPTSFETIGHIAHLNLREEHEPYKSIIGQVILDKNAAIKTVVNKVGILENTYRVLPLEVIAGESNLLTTIKQHSARFRLNYAEVYWNSRLEEEHKRLVALFKPGEVVIDVMAGIGPFAIPAAQQGNEVHANDLNPQSFHYLKENVHLNKVYGLVHPYQLDGREFIKQMAGARPDPEGGSAIESEQEMSDKQSKGGVVFQHAIMNLPATAVEFLDAFRGSFDPKLWDGQQLPLVHVYTFARTSETEADLRKRAERHIGSLLSEDFSIHLVRDVAPNKRMMRVTFRVPKKIAFGGSIIRSCEESTTDSEREKKRPRMGESSHES